MAKHNYSQYSNKNYDNKIDTTPEVDVEIQNGVSEEVEALADTTVDTTVTENITETETETVTETNSGAVGIGVVTKCARLNVRSKASTTGDVVTVLNLGDKVKIDVDNSTDEWFKIITNDGVDGYCMKKFVNANI